MSPSPKNKFASTFSKSVGIPGLLVLIIVTLLIGLYPESAERTIFACRNFVFDKLSWVYVCYTITFFVFICYIAFSKHGHIKLGRDDSKPDYSTFSWIAMLFSAGMGIGLMFYGIAEPMAHYVSPALPDTPYPAKDAQFNTFLHWGFHAWTIYAVMGLALAYFAFRYKLPLSIRSGLYPILKEKIYGPLGSLVDIFALCCTFFSITTSLGLGALQLCSGLESLGWIQGASYKIQVVIVVLVTSISIISVLLGMNKGVKRLSNLNLLMAFLLLLFVLFSGPTDFLIHAFFEGFGNYLTNIVDSLFDTYAFEPEGKQWFKDWTIMYWAWWIAWAPFVGLFIARISKGRTIREFCIGVVIIPSIFVFLWMTFFGNSAIWIDENIANGALSAAVNCPEALLFDFFKYLPFTRVINVISLVLIVIFFVTSANSGIIVIDSITSNNVKSPAWQKIFWGFLLISATSLLLKTGGLMALQTTYIVSALPFGCVMVILCYSLWKAVNADMSTYTYDVPYGSQRWDGSRWRDRLRQILAIPNQKQTEDFFALVVEPAFQELQKHFLEHDIECFIQKEGTNLPEQSIELTIHYNSINSFKYGVCVQEEPLSNLILKEKNMPKYLRNTVYVPVTYYENGRKGHNIQYFTRDELISDILREYERFLHVVSNSENELIVTQHDLNDKG